MIKEVRSGIILLAFSVCAGYGDVRTCLCDLSSPSLAETAGCSLCAEAEKHPANSEVFLVHDRDPLKPNRWLALPRSPEFDGPNPLARMSPADRLSLWSTAIAKAHEVWGDDWAIAMNGDVARRQCHAHVHIGKLIAPDEETGSYVNGPAELPVLSDGAGLWFHPAGERLHVHTGEQNNEKVLLK